MTREVIKVGDKVRVLRDRFIERVGYPLIYGMLTDEVEADPRTAEALRVLGWTGKRMPNEFVIAVAKMRVQERGFGGRQRQIIYEPPGGFGRWPGTVLEVYGKRLAKTGVYYPPSGGVNSYDGEEWYEPGGLGDCKTHIILSTPAGEIEACDVELVKR